MSWNNLRLLAMDAGGLFRLTAADPSNTKPLFKTEAANLAGAHGHLKNLSKWAVANKRDLNATIQHPTGEVTSHKIRHNAGGLKEAFDAARPEEIKPGYHGYQSEVDHPAAHKMMTKAGFARVASKGRTEQTKLGRSAAHSSSKVQESQYTHPEGHTGKTKTVKERYGNVPVGTYFHIQRQ